MADVTGLADLQRALDELPAKMEQRIMRGALGAGARVVAKQAKANASVISGALRDSIRVSSRAQKTGETTARVVAGRSKAIGDPNYAMWVEMGTAQHIINAKPGGPRLMGKYASLMHPGAKPKPFLRPAADTQSQAAIEATADYIRKRLDKLGGR